MEERADRHTVRLGAGIRTLRRSRGMTLVQLAELCDLSHPFLSQVERAVASPSMKSLDRIARALGTSQLELVAAGADLERLPVRGEPMFVANGDGERGPYSSGEARLLVRGDRRFHPMEFVASNRDPGEYHVHEEDEFVYCLDGEPTIDLESQGLWPMVRGDSLYFVGGTPHRWFSPAANEFRLFLVKQHFTTNDSSVVWDPNLLSSRTP